MEYKNTEIRILDFVNYCNEGTINLSPAFQREHVWSTSLRRNLLKNILQKKPIPAVFLYKDVSSSGSRYSYNILDGKQRLESLILFIASGSADLSIRNWKDFFSADSVRKQAGFAVETGDGSKKTFQQLPDSVIRELREYSIPTIQITLDDKTSLDEVISLFVDINQFGAPVKRFHIVKIIRGESQILSKAFDLIAVRQRRKKDFMYKMKDSLFSKLLKNLDEVRSAPGSMKVDRMWEKIIEFVLYFKDQTHRKPSEILKGFINKKDYSKKEISRKDMAKFRSRFVAVSGLARARKKHIVFTAYPHFYTLVTHVLKQPGELSASYLGALARSIDVLGDKNAKPKDSAVAAAHKEYWSSFGRGTNDAHNRKIRENVIDTLVAKFE